MKKLIGNKRKNTCIFISGTGTNLKSLIKFSKKKISPISINLVISNKKNAKGLKYADQNNIEKKIINFNHKNIAENKILKILKKKNIDLICLAGFMKILSKNFIRKFNGKIINIHPSLLPKYKGLNTHERAIENGEKFSGCTVHEVNSKLDSGKIILQERVKISSKETPKSLAKKVLKVEHKVYPYAIKKIFSP